MGVAMLGGKEEAGPMEQVGPTQGKVGLMNCGCGLYRVGGAYAGWTGSIQDEAGPI